MTWFSSSVRHGEEAPCNDDFCSRSRRSQLVTCMSTDDVMLNFQAARRFVVNVDEQIRANLATVLIHYRFEHTWHQWWIYNSPRIGSLSLGDGVTGQTTLQLTGRPRLIAPVLLNDPKRIADYLAQFIAADRPDVHRL